jgi:hypothetical protein
VSKYRMIVEVRAVSTPDEESNKRLDGLTPEQLASKVAEIEQDVRVMFEENMDDDNPEITVSVRLEKQPT